MYIPNYIKEYNIYDIFHNDENKIVIIMPYTKCNKKDIKIINENNKINFTFYKCLHNHTYIYISNNEIKYEKEVLLEINGNQFKTEINKYPNLKDKIIFSTILKDEDLYVRQWIKFHLNLGIQHYILYDNSDNDTLKDILSDYIKDGTVILIKWKYTYRLPDSGFSAQTTQQNHSIYAFKTSKYIGLFDIDEYINIQNEKKNISSFIEGLIEDKKINTDSIGSFKLHNRCFYNPNNLPTHNYEFLKIYNCDIIEEIKYKKHFVIPKNINIFAIHQIINGKKAYNVNFNLIYFNHYKFLNKENRGRYNTPYSDNSILKHINISL